LGVDENVVAEAAGTAATTTMVKSMHRKRLTMLREKYGLPEQRVLICSWQSRSLLQA